MTRLITRTPGLHIRNRLAISVLVSAALFFALSCRSDDPAAGLAISAFSDRERVENPSAPSDDLEELVAGNTGFALDLYGRLAAKDDNLFISPFSISMALGMMHPGAAGKTADEIADALNFTLPPERLHPAFNALEQLLSNRGADLDEDEKFALEIANSIWGQEGFHIEQPFLDTIAENYGSGIRLADFAGSPDASRIAINEWVEENTNDRIKELLLPPDIDEATLMVLVNAIFFKAAWQEPFEKDSDMKFQLLDGTSRTAPSMSRYGQYGYTVGENYKAVTIPYATTKASGPDTPGVSMVVVLPDAGKFKEFESSLSDEKLGQILTDLARREKVNIELPKFKFESKFHLPEQLKELGINKAFIPGEADFSGIQ